MQPTRATPLTGFALGTALTADYVDTDLLILTDDIDLLIVMNTCNQPIYLSMAGPDGTVDVYIPGMTSWAVDGRTNANRIIKQTFQAKHAGVAVTAGAISLLAIK